MTTAASVLSGRYRLSRRLAGGGMAEVWAADDLRLERTVAVKLLRRNDADAQRCFRRELGALSRMNHPAIVRLFDAGTHDGNPFMVIERVEGRTLRDLLAEGPLGFERTRILGVNLADALAHAHQHGVIHRDVKPSNILVDELDLAHLADFGIAEPAATWQGDDGLVWGTAGYAAPEQLLGGRVGAAADVYALGIVLLEALTGRREFPGTPLAAAVARVRRSPRIPAELPAPWAGLLPAMTDRNPRRRPSARTVAARLSSTDTRRRAGADDARVGSPSADRRPHRSTRHGKRISYARTIAAAGLAAVLSLAAALPVGPAASDDLHPNEEIALVHNAARSRADVAGTAVSRAARSSATPTGALQGLIGGLRAGDTTHTWRSPTPLQR